jgi:NAD(P)-dependent dehydrogenase (short-subunit alcohol dehydrogenase family)
MMGLLTGKVGLVTGGGSGMGRATALAMAREGADVTLVGRRAGPLEDVAAEIAAIGGAAEVMAADVTQRNACRAAVEQCVARFGRLDLAFNNAAVMAH